MSSLTPLSVIVLIFYALTKRPIFLSNAYFGKG